MDANIILQGQPVNLLQAMSGGAQLAAQTNAIRRQNALADLYAKQGEGIRRGDDASLNALARLDPMAALDVDKAQLDMQTQLQQLTAAKEAARTQALEMAAKLSDADAANERAMLEKFGNMAFEAQTPEAWYRVADLAGVDRAQVPWEQRGPILAGILGVSEALDLRLKQAKLANELTPQGPDWRAATSEEAQARGAAAGQINVRTGEFKAINPPMGMTIQSDGQGGFTMTQGAGVGGKPLTATESKAAGFLRRAEQAEAVLSQLDRQGTKLETQGTSLAGRMLESVPGGLGTYAQSPEYQQYEQARRDFINAILRQESGAVISQAEFDNAERQYFPVPGNDPDTIAQKARNRQAAIDALRIAAGPGAARVDALSETTAPPPGAGRGDGSGGGQDSPPGDASRFANMTLDEILGVDIDSLSDDELQAWIARATQLNGK